MKKINKILLISPPKENTVQFYPGSWQLESEDVGAFPPLGLFYLQAKLNERFPEIQTDVLDTLLLKLSHEDVRDHLIKERPDIIGISSFTVSWFDVLKLARVIRKELPETMIVLGGPHTYEYPKETLEHPEIDAIFVGESEKSFCCFINRIQQGKNTNNIKGVYTRENIHEFKKCDMAIIEDLDNLPFPLLKNYKKGEYHSSVAASRDIYIMITSRGCPYSCTFCNTMYKKYRVRSIENVMKEIDRAYQAGYKEIFFFDDTFNITNERVQEISKMILEKGYNLKWTFRGRVNTLNEETIALAKKAGLRQIHIGIETGTNEGLQKLRKGITIEQVKDVIGWARKNKVKVIGDFMIGLPFEKSVEDIKDNVRRLIKMDPDMGQFSTLEPYPGTAVFEEGVEKHVFTREMWTNFVKNPTSNFVPPVWDEYVSRKQLTALSLWAYKRFYFRPKVFWRYAKNIESFYDFYTKVKGALQLLLPR
ncbi:MAG: B12-binding domain-containing radical SAM protein [Parcubacteria group bacterium]|nr:B12-binding domain-containing radical SAM protein [Parcubacteria group bacterium]